MPNIKSLITDHFSRTKYVRPPQQLEAEKFLIPALSKYVKVPFNRILLMPAAVLIQLCVGSLYAWSGYNLAIEAHIYGTNLNAKGVPVDRNVASITFNIAVAVFGLTAAALGPWLERNGPFRGAMLGSVLFFAGHLLTALGIYVKQIAIVYIGYGFFGGIGLGISYISPVSPLQKWFPEMRGIAAGLAVCGFGGGSIIAPFAQKALMHPDFAKNPSLTIVGVPLTFIILGSIYFVLMTMAAFVLRMPPPGYTVNNITIETIKGVENLETLAPTSAELSKNDALLADKSDVTIKVEDDTVAAAQPASVASKFAMTLPESLLSKEFALTYFMFLGNEITGLLLISKIQSLIQNQFTKKSEEAILINSLLGGCNLLGRLALPLLSDLIGRKPIFIASLFAQTCFVAALPTIVTSQLYWAFLLSVFSITFLYGGGFGIIPAFLADQFGAQNVGATHGVILTSWSLAGVGGGLIFTSILRQQEAILTKDDPARGLLFIYNMNFRWIVAITALSFILCILIPTNLKDRKLPKVQGETLRFRNPLSKNLVRLVNGKFVTVSQEAEDEEWAAYLSSLGIQALRTTGEAAPEKKSVDVIEG